MQRRSKTLKDVMLEFSSIFYLTLSVGPCLCSYDNLEPARRALDGGFSKMPSSGADSVI